VRVKGEEKRAQRPRGPRKPRKPRRGRRLAAAWRRRTTGGEGAGASDERTVRCWLCFINIYYINTRGGANALRIRLFFFVDLADLLVVVAAICSEA